MTGRAWEAFPEGLDAVAPDVGPFPHRPFLETVWEHREDRSAELHVEVVTGGAVALSVSGDRLELAGQANLTDYHSPLGPNGAGAVAAALQAFPGARFRFDALPDEARAVVETGARQAGARFTVTEDEVTAVLRLPPTYEEWLASIGKKERHEVRRKRRRFEAAFGAIEVVERGVEALDAFCSMHRSSGGAKGRFMTDVMHRYFEDLMVRAGATIHTLVCDGVPRANAFGFETDDGYFYYNSAYDTDAAMASPGIVLIASLIEAQIARGATIFDFLKGDERYKFRHGAQPRPLFVVSGVMP